MPSNSRDPSDRQLDGPARELANVVRARRRALKLTQEDLSDLSGVSLRFLHDVESAKPTVQLAKLLDVLSALGLHLEVAPGASTRVEVHQ